jgi:sec-independent protein translocase protein TatB
MLDIGFSEIVVIFGLALIVLGPEKLPRVAAQVGRWIGRARGMARQFREQLEEEVNLEETRKSQPPVPKTSELPAASLPAAAPPPLAQTAATQTEAPAEQQIVYPDTYSHAHPTDSLGRPIPADAPAAGISEPMAPESVAQSQPTSTAPAPAETSQPSTAQAAAIAQPSTAAVEGSRVSAAQSATTETAPQQQTDSHRDDSQQDWVGGVTVAEKQPQQPADAAYAPPHERGA